MKTRLTKALAATLTVVVLVGTASCASKNKTEAESTGSVDLTYALWDNRQQPAYQACADAFTQQNPNIKVTLKQAGWDEYWTNLTTQLAAGSAPDVFTNHVARYPQLQKQGALLDIQQAVTDNKVDLSQYRPGLAELWERDGKRYALPKDFDTIGIFANTDMLTKAGFDLAQGKDLTWNPTDGGTFQQLIAKLSIDENGHNGTDPAFDAAHVKTYGLFAYSSADGYGQTWWANFAYSMGWKYADTNPFPKSMNYADPKLAETMTWLRSMVKKGFIPAPDKIGKLGASALLEAGTIAMSMDGSWSQSGYAAAKVPVGVIPLPTGPDGRVTLLNGLGDSVNASTKHPAEATKLALFLGSSACQDIVAQHGVVFPAITSANAKAVENMRKQSTNSKIDPQVFLDEASGKTALYPIVDKGIDVNKIAGDAMDQIMAGTADPAPALKKVGEQVNQLLAS